MYAQHWLSVPKQAYQCYNNAAVAWIEAVGNDSEKSEGGTGDVVPASRLAQRWPAGSRVEGLGVTKCRWRIRSNKSTCATRISKYRTDRQGSNFFARDDDDDWQTKSRGRVRVAKIFSRERDGLEDWSVVLYLC